MNLLFSFIIYLFIYYVVSLFIYLVCLIVYSFSSFFFFSFGVILICFRSVYLAVTVEDIKQVADQLKAVTVDEFLSENVFGVWLAKGNLKEMTLMKLGGECFTTFRVITS